MTSIVEDTPWTTNKLEQEFYLDLMKVRNSATERKYEEQAKQLIHKIPVYRPIPSFVVSLADLSDRVKLELRGLDPKSLNELMKAGIGRIFENIDERYFLLNVKKLLRWELVE